MTNGTPQPGDLVDLYQRTVDLLDKILASHRATNARMTANSKAILDLIQMLNEKGLLDRDEADKVIRELKTVEE
ncbi:MAG: hypothetical protein GVY13_08645 [Alphaproteobacteria bacterium]|jgi:hypothetical protein|nr:hypothetical protein [Alphaproteobacteria bacterium]